MTAIPRILTFAHYLLKEKINLGDHVIDATMGNGHDTIFLASFVGPTGHVYAFDIQDKALQNTSQRLTATPYQQRISLYKQDHSQMHIYIEQAVSCIIFNLGYLPGQNKSITTQADNTIKAIQEGLNCLKAFGLMVLVVYPGHPEGLIEAQAIDRFLPQLSTKDYLVARYQIENKDKVAPYVLAIEKKN